MKIFRTRTACICVVVFLALFIDEGLCRGGRGGSRGGRSRGGSYGGGGGGSYSGSGSPKVQTNKWNRAGTTTGIVFGIIGGCIGFSVLICLCVMCFQKAGRKEQGNGVVTSSRTGQNMPMTNFDQIIAKSEPTNLPPAYGAIDEQVITVQDELKDKQPSGSLINYGYHQENIQSPARPASNIKPKQQEKSSRKIIFKPRRNITTCTTRYLLKPVMIRQLFPLGPLRNLR